MGRDPVSSKLGVKPRASSYKRLLDDAIDYMMKNGVRDLSLRQLAEAIGTSHRMLLYHFGSKHQLIACAVEEVRAREQSLFASEATESIESEPLESLWRTWERWSSDEWTPYFSLLFEYWGIALRDPAGNEPFLGNVVQSWVDALADILERDGIPRETAEKRATLILASIRGLRLDLCTTGDSARVNEALLELFELLRAPSVAGAGVE